MRASSPNTRKWITVSRRINRVQATHYKRATIPVDQTTGLALFGDNFTPLSELVLCHSDIIKYPSSKGGRVGTPDWAIARRAFLLELRHERSHQYEMFLYMQSDLNTLPVELCRI